MGFWGGREKLLLLALGVEDLIKGREGIGPRNETNRCKGFEAGSIKKGCCFNKNGLNERYILFGWIRKVSI